MQQKDECQARSQAENSQIAEPRNMQSKVKQTVERSLTIAMKSREGDMEARKESVPRFVVSARQIYETN